MPEEQKFTEENMNPPGTGDIAEAFKNPAHRILFVAASCWWKRRRSHEIAMNIRIANRGD